MLQILTRLKRSIALNLHRTTLNLNRLQLQIIRLLMTILRHLALHLLTRLINKQRVNMSKKVQLALPYTLTEFFLPLPDLPFDRRLRSLLKNLLIFLLSDLACTSNNALLLFLLLFPSNNSNCQFPHFYRHFFNKP